MSEADFQGSGQCANGHEHSVPLFPEVGVLAFVPEEWGGIWLSRHQVLTRLSKYFHVVWADPAKEWREMYFGKKNRAGYSKQDDVFSGGFIRYHPEWWLPKLYRPAVLASWTATQRIQRAIGVLRRRGCRNIIFYLWRPNFDHVLQSREYDLSCYHIVDEYSFSASEQPLDDREVSLMKRVDQVFIHSHTLFERKGQFNPNTAFVPNGVDYKAFATTQAEPEDLKKVKHPRIGYIGNIKVQLDFPLLFRLAVRHPEWSFVFVGPKGYLGQYAAVIEQLSRLSNVYFLGAKPIELVAAYPQHMDVCLLPYMLDGYTKYIYPLKLHEYLASGRPVVGSPISALQEFSSLIALAESDDEWSAAIEAALKPEMSTSDRCHARREIARKYDWEALVIKIAGTLCERLGTGLRQRFDQVVRSTTSVAIER